MKVLFLGDTTHPNAVSWISGMKKYTNIEIETNPILESKYDNSSVKRVLRWVKAINYFRKTKNTSKYDIIIGYRITSYGFLAAVSNHKCIVIAAQGETDVWPKNSISTPFKEALARYAIEKAHLVHCWGVNMSKSIISMGCDLSKLLILPRGIDLDLFKFPNELKKDSFEIVCTRGLHSDYRHNIILQALEMLKNDNIDFRFNIIGDGVERANITNLINNLGLKENVNMIGRISSEEIVKYLQKSTIYISVPISEGVSASLLEAMACGCYPIVTNLAANREWIEDKINGLLVEIDDVFNTYNALKNAFLNRSNLDSIIYKNRELIENKVSQEKNMKLFYNRYKEIQNVCAV